MIQIAAAAAAPAPLPVAPLPVPANDPAAVSAVIDIGSNSVRLVVYRCGTRAPAMLFNEKVMAGLGGGVTEGDALEQDAMEVALASLARFTLVARAMGVTHPRCVATAATRQATNGAAFVERIQRETGLAIAILSGEAEARGSAYGVISGIPGADGIVGDLGGGSLELIRVSGGEPQARASVPVGSLKLIAARDESARALDSLIAAALDEIDWLREGDGLPFYAVGGSWRALAHLDMALVDHPLPVIHQYTMAADAPDRLARTLQGLGPKALRAVPNLARERVPALPGAAALLGEVVRRAGSSSIVTSSYGLREGLLYLDLSHAERARDPLLAAAEAEAVRSGRFADTGPVLARWIAPLFADDLAPLVRIRDAAAILSDIGWSANPDFRAARAVDAALHGPWVAITLPERAILAAALQACFGGGEEDDPANGDGRWRELAHAHDLQRARAWGLALRLGQRLSGGAAGPIARSSLERDGETLRLRMPADQMALMAPPVRRRLKALAEAMGLGLTAKKKTAASGPA